MKLDDLPSAPGKPELVVTDAVPTSGLDLLGLRVPAETVANSLLDGITTITPTVRYLSVRAWIIHRYQQLNGLDDRKEFMKFAHKVESALVFGNLLSDASTPGLIGHNFASNAMKAGGKRLSLEPMVKTPAMRVYAGPSEVLGIAWSGGRVPGITRERGLPLAVAVDPLLRKSPIPASISADSDSCSHPREELQQLGRVFSMRRPEGRERDALLEFVIPDSPGEDEAPRVATYCLLLHLCRQAGAIIKEADVFDTAVAPDLDSVPRELQACCEGWARFVVRDMLVAVHEAAVALVARHIQTTGAPGNRRLRQNVLAELASSELDQGFVALGFAKMTGDTPVSTFWQRVAKRLGAMRVSGNIRRWDGNLTELDLIAAAKPSVPALVTLPLAWAMAVQRMDPGIQAELPGFDLDGQRAASRIGVRDVIMPVVSSWANDATPLRDVIATLIARSVDQHLRIAWSRLAREPWKDVSVLASDGDEWLYCQDINNGRATSRLYQAINWLEQLGLIDENGLTRDGEVVLDSRLAAMKHLGVREP